MSGQLPRVASILILPCMLGLTSCAHQSTVAPSEGHIDNGSPAVVQAADIPKPVKSSNYLPPPKPRVKEQTYSVVVNDVPVKEILFALARESKLNIDIHPAIQGRATLNAVDQTLPAILERLAKQVDLTYRVDGNVLSITPDMPVLRSYKVDYVNMSRDTTGFIGAAAEIASTGRSASTTSGTSGSTSSGTSSGTGTGAANSSRTAVNSLATNHFWETLVQNLKDILAETDKEVIITRTGTGSSQSNEAAIAEAGDGATQAASHNATQQREEARTEYKTLFAATVIASPETGIISVRATHRQHEKVQEFLDKVMDSAKRQVLIEASIVEVTLSDTYQAGIDWSRIGNGFNMTNALGMSSILSATSASNTLAGTSAPFAVGYSSTNSDLAFKLRLLQQFGDTKVLSSPKLMVLNNQTAVLKVVDNLVYFTIQSQISQGTVQGSSNLQSVTTTPNTVPVGVVMSVTPQINDAGSVNINIRPTISRVLKYVEDPNPQLAAVTPAIVSRIPEIQVRELESMLRIDSGNTAVLGGLMQDNIQQATDKVPGIAKVPLLGKLFTARSNFNVKTELVIFLRPVVIHNASLESEELSGYKQYLPAQQLQRLIDESVN